ncbi:MAG: TolB family protein [Phycisphaerales bacterium]
MDSRSRRFDLAPLTLTSSALSIALALACTAPLAIGGQPDTRSKARADDAGSTSDTDPKTDTSDRTGDDTETQPEAPNPLDWGALESPILTNHVQLTFPDRFLRAGEAYFDPTAQWIIFQAVEVPEEGAEPDEHFSMYVAPLIYARASAQEQVARITGMGRPIRISNPGSANTCGWFHPRTPWTVIYGSTLVAPEVDGAPGYQRGTGRYKWQFPNEMEIVTQSVQEIFDSVNRDLGMRMALPEQSKQPRPLISQPGYTAECAYDPVALHIVFCNVDPETGDGDLFAYNTRTRVITPLITEPGYDGGPFFSPDGKRICYRSDRRGDNMLQLFVADLEFDAAGSITGVVKEHQLTDNQHVNWAPYWHPSGNMLVYATSEAGHDNYEVYAIPVPPRFGTSAAMSDDGPVEPIRITNASGFDGLPVFSRDAKYMLWTSQRGGPWDQPGQRPTSQLWIAEFTPDAALERIIESPTINRRGVEGVKPTPQR